MRHSIEAETTQERGRAAGITFAGALNFLTEGLHRIGVYFCLPLLTLLVLTDVGLRYVLRMPLAGSNEAAGVLLLLILLLSLPLTTARNRHIQVELVYEHLAPRARAMADVVGAIAGGFIAGGLAWHCLHAARSEFRYEEATLLLEVPLWPLSLVTGLVSALLVILYAVSVARSVLDMGR